MTSRRPSRSCRRTSARVSRRSRSMRSRCYLSPFIRHSARFGSSVPIFGGVTAIRWVRSPHTRWSARGYSWGSGLRSRTALATGALSPSSRVYSASKTPLRAGAPWSKKRRSARSTFIKSRGPRSVGYQGRPIISPNSVSASRPSSLRRVGSIAGNHRRRYSRSILALSRYWGNRCLHRLVFHS